MCTFKWHSQSIIVEFKENEGVRTKCFNYFQEYIRNCRRMHFNINLIMVGTAVFVKEFEILWVFVP
jgi:hypothetical protein